MRIQAMVCVLVHVCCAGMAVGQTPPCLTQTIAPPGAGSAFGTHVAVSGAWMATNNKTGQSGPNQFTVYLYEREPTGLWAARQTISPGGTMALEGNRLVIGNRYDAQLGANAGALYVYARDPSTNLWNQEATIVAPAGGPNGNFGSMVSLSGERIVASSHQGANVQVFHRDDNGQWMHEVTLTSPTGDPEDGFPGRFQISGDRLAVGAPFRHVGTGDFNWRGVVCTYQYTASGWIVQQILEAPEDDIGFGTIAALSGNRLAVGTGSAIDPIFYSLSVRFFVFEPLVNQWIADGTFISPQFSDAIQPFPWLALDGSRAVRGDRWPWSDTFGKVMLFDRLEDYWEQTWSVPVQLPGSPSNYSGAFGQSVAISGNTVVVGDFRATGLPGRVYVYEFGEDCNANGTCDNVDIASGMSLDHNGNGSPDECDRPGDANGDGHTDVVDLLIVINGWGPCASPPASCPGDVSPWSAGDGQVAISDLLLVLMNWG